MVKLPVLIFMFVFTRPGQAALMQEVGYFLAKILEYAFIAIFETNYADIKRGQSFSCRNVSGSDLAPHQLSLLQGFARTKTKTIVNDTSSISFMSFDFF